MSDCELSQTEWLQWMWTHVQTLTVSEMHEPHNRQSVSQRSAFSLFLATSQQRDQRASPELLGGTCYSAHVSQQTEMVGHMLCVLHM